MEENMEDKIRILREPGYEAGLNKESFNVRLSPDVRQWFDDIVKEQRWCKSGPLVCLKILHFYSNRTDVLELALKLFAQAPDCGNPKANSLSTHLIKTLPDYTKQLPAEMKHVGLNSNLQMVAFNFFHKHPLLFTIAIDVYDLKVANTLFLDRIRDLLQESMYKEVCEIVRQLELHEHFGIHEFIVPLILQDRLSVVEQYLAKAPNITTELVVFLDTWLDHNEQFQTFYDCYLAQIPYPINEVNYSKLRRKTFKKLVKRYADTYGVPRQMTPYLKEMDSYGMLKKLIEKKYLDKQISDWDEFIIEQVNPSSQALIDELINSCCDYEDYAEAVKWTKYFKVKADKYTYRLQEYMET